MSKWTNIYTNSVEVNQSNKELRAKRVKNAYIADKMIKTIKSEPSYVLKKLGEEHFLEEVNRRKQLLDAFEAKKLKSKKLIQEAKRLQALEEKKKVKPPMQDKQ